MEEELVVIVIEGGIVTEVYSDNANQKIIAVDIDNRKIGGNSITEFTWIDTQFDIKRVAVLLKERR